MMASLCDQLIVDWSHASLSIKGLWLSVDVPTLQCALLLEEGAGINDLVI